MNLRVMFTELDEPLEQVELASLTGSVTIQSRAIWSVSSN